MMTRPVKLAHDTWLIFQRQWKLTFRTPVAVAFGLAQPITYLVLFAPILKLALSAEGVTTYAQAFRVYVPGLLTVMAVIGGMFAGASACWPTSAPASSSECG